MSISEAQLKILVILLSSLAVKSEEFEYSNQANWYDNYEQCGLYHQSPIELNSEDAQLCYDIPVLSFQNYDTPYRSSVKMTNTGRTVSIQLLGSRDAAATANDSSLPHITGGPLARGRFIAETVHFHWGSRDSHGSEHVIDSERYSMEMHVVHRNSKYGTVTEAGFYEDGLAVLAVMFSVKESKAVDSRNLEGVTTSLDTISELGASTAIANLDLASLMVNLDYAAFFTYQGSLTTPPCSEAVTWVVFPHAVPVSHLQMDHFRNLTDSHGAKLVNNYRYLQAKGNRKLRLRKTHSVLDSIVESPAFRGIIDKLSPELHDQRGE